MTTAAAAGGGAGCSRDASPWRFFTVPEAATIEAIAERLIPGDQDAGARDAGVVSYIDRQLTGHYRKLRDAYRQGLAALDAKCVSEHGKRFVELDAARQDRVLAAFEQGSPDQRRVFNLWLEHTVQGYFGSPRHGGNRDAVSWRMLGVPVIPVRGQQHYESRPEKG